MIIHSSDDPGNSIGSTNSNLNNTSSNRTTKFEDDILLEPYILRKEISEFGYFYNNGREEIQLTNFIVKLEKQVIAEVNNKPEIYFSGKVEFTEGETVEIRKLRGKDLASPLQLITYLTNLCGTKISFPGSPNKLVEAIKTFNRDTELLRAEEFGYNEDLTEYITSDLVITKDSFIEKETAIKYNDLGKRNKLGFSLGSDDEFLEIKNGIIEDFLPWDSTQRTISALSFTFLPIIFPHLENVNEKKTYLMLKGPSGCGKSLMCEVLQQFYGDFKSLIPWNSTSTSINVAGHSFKDSAFMVDDFKSQSFNGPNKVNEVMTLLQNYADQTSKQRSNISLTIRDEKYIKGFLTISAEDLVISEASTIARGIIIDMENKIPNLDGEAKLRKTANNFKIFTPQFIQFILRKEKSDIENLFNNNKIHFLDIQKTKNLNGNNIPRLVNNFALLKTSWDLLREFLFSDLNKEIGDEYDFLYQDDLEHLFIENYRRVQDLNPEVKFENTLWELIENGTLILTEIGSEDYQENKRVGYFEKHISDDSIEIKIAINMRKSFNGVNAVLKDEGGIGNSLETLTQKLVQAGKIRTVPSGRISFRKEKQRGVEWIADFPKHIFGIRGEANTVTLGEFLDENGLPF